MHEVSIAEDIMQAIERSLGQKTPLKTVSMTIGPLSGVSPDSLAFCFPIVARQCGFGSPHLRIDRVKARIRCAKCGNDYELTDFHEACPRCGSRAREVLSGSELSVDSVETEEDSNV
jgi:hydrogenase nickel incorporation protein HypA/HybF